MTVTLSLAMWGCYLFNMGVDDLEEGFQDSQPHQQEANEETLGRTDDFPAASTPKRVRDRPEMDMSPIASGACKRSFELLPRVANIPPWIQKPKDSRLKDRGLRSYKFVDDSVNTSPVNMRGAALLEQDGKFFKQIIHKRTENLLKHIAERAANKRMRINAARTSLICVSAAATFDSKVQVELDGQTIDGTNNMKILGVTVDSDGSFKTHVENLRAKLRKRTWVLSRLRRRGIP